MFRSDEQSAQAFRVLLARIGRADACWTLDGRPTPFLVGLFEGKDGKMSTSERQLCKLTLALWNGAKGVDFSVLNSLDNGNLFAVASLLEAIALGADFVDAWMVEQHAIQAQEKSAVDAYIAGRAGKVDHYLADFAQRHG